MAPKRPGKSLVRLRGRWFCITMDTVYNPSYFITKNKNFPLSISEDHTAMDIEVASSVADTTGDAMSATTVEHGEQLSLDVDEADFASDDF